MVNLHPLSKDASYKAMDYSSRRYALPLSPLPCGSLSVPGLLCFSFSMLQELTNIGHQQHPTLFCAASISARVVVAPKIK